MFVNRLVLMSENRLVKRMLRWGWEIWPNNWCAEIKRIEFFEQPELEYGFDEMCPVDHVDVNMIRNLMTLRSKKT